jgi:CDP-glycerol glycerophosphotransferase (TagB/SpsB family)
MFSLISKSLTALDIALTKPLFVVSKLMPRCRDLWVFIGWHKGPHGEIFADNCKYLFLHASRIAPGIDCVWLAKDDAMVVELRKRGFKAYRETSLAGIWTALRAGTTIVDATLQRFNARWVGRSRLVQLLHGKGMKKGAYGETLLRPYDYVFNTSDYASAMLPDSLKADAKIMPLGYSRHAPLFEDVTDADLGTDAHAIAFVKAERAAGRRVVMYAPTFRRGMKELPIEEFLPFHQMAAWLNDANMSLIVNLHPKYRMQAKGIDMPHMAFAGDGDVNPLLAYVDVLVTDYSSIFTDFLLLDRPMVFYAFDLDDYAEREGLAIDYDTVPGEVASDFPSLLAGIERAITLDPAKQKRRVSAALYHSHADAKASERILNELID